MRQTIIIVIISIGVATAFGASEPDPITDYLAAGCNTLANSYVETPEEIASITYGGIMHLKAHGRDIGVLKTLHAMNRIRAHGHIRSQTGLRYRDVFGAWCLHIQLGVTTRDAEKRLTDIVTRDQHPANKKANKTPKSAAVQAGRAVRPIE